MGMIHRQDRSRLGQGDASAGWAVNAVRHSLRSPGRPPPPVARTAARPAASEHAFPLPAPALQVARLHGVDLEAVSIAWAHPAGGGDVQR